MPVQLTIAHNITDQINLLASREEHSEFELRRIRREIEQLKAVDACQYYMIVGMFYSVVGDKAESISNHEKSLKLSSETIFLENYAFSLKRLGAGPEALQILLRAFDAAPTEEVLEEVAHAMIYTGDLNEFERTLQRFARANPDKDPASSSSVSYIVSLQGKLARAKVSYQDLKLSMDLVQDLIWRKGYRNAIEAINFDTGSFDDVPHVDVSIKLKTRSCDALFEINEGIAEAMAGAEHIEAWNRLVFTVCDWHGTPEEHNVA